MFLLKMGNMKLSPNNQIYFTRQAKCALLDLQYQCSTLVFLEFVLFAVWLLSGGTIDPSSIVKRHPPSHVCYCKLNSCSTWHFSHRNVVVGDRRTGRMVDVSINPNEPNGCSDLNRSVAFSCQPTKLLVLASFLEGHRSRQLAKLERRRDHCGDVIL